MRLARLIGEDAPAVWSAALLGAVAGASWIGQAALVAAAIHGPLALSRAL